MDASTNNMKEAAYQYLKGKILNCEISPGQAISEAQIVDALSAGRTPVREAIIILQREGLVEVFPRKGTCAKTITVADTAELYQLRKLIEPTVAVQFKQLIPPERLMDFDARFQAACDLTGRESDIDFYRLDIEFHSFIVQTAGNSLLRRIFADIMQATYRIGIFSSLQRLNNAKKETSEEHHRIIRAILMEDDAEILSAFTTHINRSLVSSLETLKSAEASASQ